jgi:hypothetical protein
MFLGLKTFKRSLCLRGRRGGSPDRSLRCRYKIQFILMTMKIRRTLAATNLIAILTIKFQAASLAILDL